MANITKKLTAGQFINDEALDASAGLINITTGKAAVYNNINIINSTSTINDITIAGDKYSSVAIANITSTGKVGNVKMTAAAGATVSANVNTTNGNVGNITTDATGANADVTLNINATVAKDLSTIATISGKSAAVGNVLVNSTGIESDSEVNITGTDAKIGNVIVNTKGLSSEANVFLESNSVLSGANTLQGGSIGNITLLATGADSYLSSNSITVVGEGGTALLTGSMGNITATASGLEAEVYSDSIRAINANIGNITAVASGEDSQLYFNQISTIGGNIGNVSLTTSGVSSGVELSATANAAEATGGLLGGNIGNVTAVAKGFNSYIDSNFTSATKIGAVTATASAAYAETNIDVTATNGDIGTVTTNTTGFDAETVVRAFANNGIIAAVSANASASADSDIFISARSLGAVTVKATGAGSEATVRGTISAANISDALVGGKVGNITITATGQEASTGVDFGVRGIVASNATDYTIANTVKVGNIVSNVSGEYAYGTVRILANSTDALGVDFGNVTAKATGTNAEQRIEINTLAGNIGNVNMNVAGSNANGRVTLNTGSLSANDGKIGNVAITATGIDAYMNNSISAQTSISTLTTTVNGFSAESYTNVSLGNYDAAVKAAALGNVTLNVKGDSAYSNTYIYGTDGSDVANVALNLQGGSNVSAVVNTDLTGTDTDVANLGNLTVVANNANASGNDVTLNLGGTNNAIGNITGTITGGETAVLGVYASVTSNVALNGGTIGNVTLSSSSEQGLTIFNAEANVIGNVTVNATGAQSTFNVSLAGSNSSLNVGAVNVNLSTDLTGKVDAITGLVTYFNPGNINIGEADIVGAIKLVGGSATSQVALNVESNSLGVVDFGGFKGNGFIALGNVDSAVTVIGAKGGNTIATTSLNDTITTGAGADIITTYAGVDTVKFLKVATGNVLDTITDFTKNSDILSFSKAGLTGGSAIAVGALTEVNFTANDTGLADSGLAQFIFNTATSVLSYDADGSGAGAAVNIVTLVGVADLVATDIMIG